MSQRRCSSSVSFSSACSPSSTLTPSSSSSSYPLRINEQQSEINSAFGRARSSSSSPKSYKSSSISSLLKINSQSDSNTISSASFCWPLVRPNYKRSSSVRHFRQNNSSNTKKHFPLLVKLFSISHCSFEENPSPSNSHLALITQNNIPNQINCSSTNQKISPKSNGDLQSINVQKKRKIFGGSGNDKNNPVQRSWPNKITIPDVLLILILQFIWILPYIFIVNYLERCLLPFRIYCYTDPDLLVVRRALRSSTEDCAAYFFAHNGNDNERFIDNTGEHGIQNGFSFCNSNKTISALLHPWNANLDNPKLQRIIVIRTAPRALEYRKFIRSSWKTSVEHHSGGPVIFVTGRDGTELALENTEHGDILQLDFEDSYRNLSTKMMGIYSYFTVHTNVQQIVVINDDTIVNATALNALFLEIEHWQNTSTSPDDKRYLIGKVSRGYPRLVFPWLPWYVSAEQYPHKCYPPFVQNTYLQGSSFIISRDAAVDVLHRICDFPWKHVHLDDVQMGILTNCMGINNFHREGFF
uniref:Hexosyltransferase n=1 Tax=Meloidogyne hapla TaxID=6305 RepID=A0A1I8BH84_MELHA